MHSVHALAIAVIHNPGTMCLNMNSTSSGGNARHCW